MSVPVKPRKRIVSKGEYVQVQGRRILLWGTALLMLLNGMFFVYLIMNGKMRSITIFPKWVEFAALSVYGIGLFWSAKTYAARGRAIEPVIPLNRTNAAQLPAPESLVRASAEAVQEQQNVLLRAATPTQEAHQEQLLRAAGE